MGASRRRDRSRHLPCFANASPPEVCLIQRAVEESPPGFQSMGLSRAHARGPPKGSSTSTPSPIQAGPDPRGPRRPKDVIGQAKTGTGKTAAFGIPLIEMLEARGKGPQGHHPGTDPGTRPADRRRDAEAGPRPGRLRLRDLRRRADREAAPGPGARASTSSSAPPAACSTTSSGGRSTSARSSTSSSTRPTGCSTSGSGPTSSGSSARSPTRTRPCSSPRRSARTSASSPVATCTSPSR